MNTTDATPATDRGSAVERPVRPRAWMGPSGQTMPDEIYTAWAPIYPDDAMQFLPLYDQDALDAAAADTMRELGSCGLVDAQWWLLHRVQIVAAVEDAGFSIVSNSGGEVRLLPRSDLAKEWLALRAVGGVAGPNVRAKRLDTATQTGENQ